MVVGGVITLFNGEITFKSPDFESLNNIGGFFNIVTSLAGVATVWLLAEAIMLQKKELKEVSNSMKAQNDKLREQIDSSKNEEKTNRAMKLYDEWLKIKSNYDFESIRIDSGLDVVEAVDPLVSYIERITIIKNSAFSEYIDLDTLKKILDKERIIDRIEGSILRMEGMREGMHPDDDGHLAWSLSEAIETSRISIVNFNDAFQ